MQRHLFVAITGIAVSATFLAACGKKEEPPPPPPPAAEAPKPAQPTGADPKLFLTQPLAIDFVQLRRKSIQFAELDIKIAHRAERTHQRLPGRTLP